jgi:hypothetical protein
MDSAKAIASGFDLMLAPVEVLASMVDVMVKLQQETWVAMADTATTGLRELARD